MSDAMLEKFMNVKGQFMRAEWVRTVAPAAAHKGRQLTKRTKGVFRGGINYANLTPVKAGIEAGERGPVGPLPWGEWEIFPHLIQHKGSRYCRLYPATGGRVETEYFVDGEPSTKEDFEALLRPSDRSKPDDCPECFTVKLDNIKSLCNLDNLPD